MKKASFPGTSNFHFTLPVHVSHSPSPPKRLELNPGARGATPFYLGQRRVVRMWMVFLGTWSQWHTKKWTQFANKGNKNLGNIQVFHFRVPKANYIHLEVRWCELRAYADGLHRRTNFHIHPHFHQHKKSSLVFTPCPQIINNERNSCSKVPKRKIIRLPNYLVLLRKSQSSEKLQLFRNLTSYK